MSTDRLAKRVERLAALLEPRRRKLYDLVYDQSDPVSRDEAADRVGISRAMAAFHLARLVEAGLLRAEYRRLAAGRAGSGTGRPSKLYRRSRSRVSVALLRRAFELLARLLAMTLDEPGAPATPRQAGR